MLKLFCVCVFVLVSDSFIHKRFFVLVTYYAGILLSGPTSQYTDFYSVSPLYESSISGPSLLIWVGTLG